MKRVVPTVRVLVHVIWSKLEKKKSKSFINNRGFKIGETITILFRHYLVFVTREGF